MPNGNASDTVFEIIFIAVLILVNGLLAMAEIAFVSVRKARLQYRAEAGDRRAQEALELANNPSDMLSATQIGITLVGILAGAFGGATIASRLAALLGNVEVLAPYSNAIAIFLVVTVISYLSLILGELAPKRLALSNAERVASQLAGPMRLLARMTSPIVRFLTFSTDVVLRLLGARPSDEPPVTEDEIRVLLEQGTEAGVFEEAEQDMVEGVFRLGDRRVGLLMTPRREIIWLDLEDPPEETQRKIIQSVHSRLPVAEGSLDQVVGIVQAKVLLVRILSGEALDLGAALEPAQYIPESMPALRVLKMFRESGVHVALVVDEFGGIQGLVSLFDILEAIVGDIAVVGQVEESEVIRREDGSWLLDGGLPIDEFKEIFDLTALPEEDRGYYQTLGGFIMTHLGRVPSTSDHFEWAGLRIEVVDMDGFRIDKVIVLPERGEKTESGSSE
jgi:putative hemolysin